VRPAAGPRDLSRLLIPLRLPHAKRGQSDAAVPSNRSSSSPNSRAVAVPSTGAPPRTSLTEGPPPASFSRANTKVAPSISRNASSRISDDPGGVAARPEGRQGHHAAQISQAATQSCEFFGWRFAWRLHVRPPARVRAPRRPAVEIARLSRLPGATPDNVWRCMI
jgi:hypothetical protein